MLFTVVLLLLGSALGQQLSTTELFGVSYLNVNEPKVPLGGGTPT